MQRLKRFLRMYHTQVLHGSIVVLSILLAWLVVIPQVQIQVRRFGVMRETEKNIEQLKAKQIQLNSFESGALETAYRTVVTTIPKEKILGSMMTGLDNLMSDYEITLLSFSFDAVGSIGTDSAAKKGKKETTVYSSIPITVMIEGKLENIRNFLDSANRTRPLYLIKNFDLMFSPIDKTFRSKITMEAFYMALPKALGSVASKLNPLSATEQTLLEKITAFPELARLTNSVKIITIPSSPMKSDPFAP